MFDLISEADRLDRRIRELPRGSISRKTINGKVRHYRQWYEDGRTKGVYIRDQDLERVDREIEERKRCQEELAEVRSKIEGMKASLSDGGLYNRVMTGEDLIRWACRTEGWEARDSLRDLVTFLGSDDDRVCTLYGLRRTGKTTMIRQAIAAMSPEDRWASAYVSVDGKGSMAKLCHDIRVLRAQGIRFLFIDEVTLLEDFVSGSSVFSDIYTAFGRMRIVLTGTDSLAFRFAGADRLYDRTLMIHTTYIPFREHCRLVRSCTTGRSRYTPPTSHSGSTAGWSVTTTRTSTSGSGACSARGSSFWRTARWSPTVWRTSGAWRTTSTGPLSSTSRTPSGTPSTGRT